MIHVSHLTKYYGDYAAVRDVSFDVAAGQVVGFLGHNGAGKSTTMRILTGYLAPTSGSATIAGLDVFNDSVEVRRKVGYMPESCPLYTDMRVEEYLNFRAGIKGIHGGFRPMRVDFVLRRCWLTDVRRQIIGTLSKGYRQRVGLADSLLANPPVLILDEPTAGLDPTQIRSTRDLIRELGQEHTILLSTHILSEVEMTADSVIIIHQGQVALQSSIKDLQAQAGSQGKLLAVFDGHVDGQGVRDLETFGPTEAKAELDRTEIRIRTNDIAGATRKVLDEARTRGWTVREVRPERPTLEDLFVQITARA
ncbi:MAG: ABC transporter ATP-binding protein [Gemmataceae bacterium]|nr:ABC transporter ATP-binding protein [Gemmataceae bacterium]